jgi:hypothetical protein
MEGFGGPSYPTDAGIRFRFGAALVERPWREAMPKTVGGTIRTDENAAHKNMPSLIPHLVRYVPAVEGCARFGTIDIDLDRPMLVNNADCWTDEITWDADFEKGRVERFGLLEVQFEYPAGGPCYRSWIFLAEGSPLTLNPHQTEIISDSFIEQIAMGESCKIHIDHIPNNPRPDCFGERYFQSLLII